MSSNCSQHQSLKKAFLGAPYGDLDPELVSDLQNENGLSSVQVKRWFTVMRQRLNVQEFVFGDIEYNDMTDEDVTDDVKQRSSPLDVLIDFSGLKISNEDDSGNFEEAISSSDEDCIVEEKDNAITKNDVWMWTYGAPNALSLYPSLKEISEKEASSNEDEGVIIEVNDDSSRTTEAPYNWDNGMHVRNKALNVNAPPFISSPKKKDRVNAASFIPNGSAPSSVSSSPQPQAYNENENVKWNKLFKEENLSVEEKARRFDLYRQGMKNWMDENEQMRKCLKGLNPPADNAWPRQQARQPPQASAHNHQLPPQFNPHHPPSQFAPQYEQPAPQHATQYEQQTPQYTTQYIYTPQFTQYVQQVPQFTQYMQQVPQFTQYQLQPQH